jgi:hypothetical protein
MLLSKKNVHVVVRGEAEPSDNPSKVVPCIAYPTDAYAIFVHFFWVFSPSPNVLISSGVYDQEPP